MWDTTVIPKHTIIAWMVMLGRLHVFTRITRYNAAMDVIRPMCQEQEETQQHLPFSCEFTEGIRIEVLRWPRVNTVLQDMK